MNVTLTGSVVGDAASITLTFDGPSVPVKHWVLHDSWPCAPEKVRRVVFPGLRSRCMRLSRLLLSDYPQTLATATSNKYSVTLTAPLDEVRPRPRRVLRCFFSRASQLFRCHELFHSQSLTVTLTPVRADGATGNTFTSAATIVYSPVGEWLQVRCCVGVGQR